MKVRIDYLGNTLNFYDLYKTFPFLVRRILAEVGFRAARDLYEEHLTGEDLEFHTKRFSSTGAPLSEKRGKRMVSYSVDPKGQFVLVSSFPVNLFEKGRKLRSGKMEPGKFILRRFEKNFRATLVAREYFERMLLNNEGVRNQAEAQIRGSFSIGESPYGRHGYNTGSIERRGWRTQIRKKDRT
ncbi:MAG: hypothetical protein LBH70_05825 [Spirochaetaceae bacterium]|jgi:hypothetical protein|nr:hypothetical protein [Spirochaetaceae bacterium]